MKSKDLVEKVAIDRLNTALSVDVEPEEKNRAFKEGMEAAKLYTEMNDKKTNVILKCVEVAAVPVALFVGGCIFKNYAMNKTMRFETEGINTSSAGKGLFQSLFRNW